MDSHTQKVSQLMHIPLWYTHKVVCHAFDYLRNQMLYTFGSGGFGAIRPIVKTFPDTKTFKQLILAPTAGILTNTAQDIDHTYEKWRSARFHQIQNTRSWAFRRGVMQCI